MRSLIAATTLVLALAPMALAATPIPTLSYFKAVRGGMSWARFEQGKYERPIATFLGAGSPRAAWSHDRKKAIVWLDGREADKPSKAWVVPTTGGRPTDLPLPGKDVRAIGFDKQGMAHVLVMMDAEAKNGPKAGKDKKGDFLTFEGKRYDLPAGREGIAALAFDYRREGNAWKRVETQLTSDGWDYAATVKDLKSYATLGPRTDAMLDEPEGFTAVADKALQGRLKALNPKVVSEGGEWGQMKTAGGPVFVWRESSEFLHSTSQIAWGTAAKPVSVPGLGVPNPKEHAFRQDLPSLRLVAPMFKGAHMLVTTTDGAFPRLYDVAAKKLLWSSNAVKTVTFWP